MTLPQANILQQQALKVLRKYCTLGQTATILNIGRGNKDYTVEIQLKVTRSDAFCIDTVHELRAFEIGLKFSYENAEWIKKLKESGIEI